MSGQSACEHSKPRRVAITHYKCNYSAFNGGRRTPSAYSEVQCMVKGCGRRWRTKAAWVEKLHNDSKAFFEEYVL